MPRKATRNPQQFALDASFALSSAPGVPTIREAVNVWRDRGYPGTTASTRELLAYWFKNDHRQRHSTARSSSGSR